MTTPPCAGQWRLFDSTDPADHIEARALCRGCPLIDRCLRDLADVQRNAGAYGQPVGTWAGRLFGEDEKAARRAYKIARAERIATEEAAWTDEAAYAAHLDYQRGIRNERTRTGHRIHQRRAKVARGRRAGGEPREHGTEEGYQWHRYRRDFTCDACRKAHAAHERERKSA